MTMPLYNSKRLGMLNLLPVNWVEKIAKDFKGVTPTVYPDESMIVSGNDEECIATLKKYGLYSEAVETYMTGGI